MSTLPPLGWSVALTSWQVNAVSDVLAVAAILWYVLAARSARRAGTGWPGWRTACFVIGVAVAVFSISGVVGRYSMSLFSMHMAQHLLLIMVAPALIIVGSPWALAVTGHPDGRISRVLHGRFVGLLARPAFGVLLYLAVVGLTHLTGFQQATFGRPWLHWLEIVAYLVGGYVFLTPLLGQEPLRRDVPYLVRVVALIGSGIVDTGVGIALMLTDTDIFPGYAASRNWGPSGTSDLNLGGAMMWVGGDGLMMAIAIVVVGRWLGDDSRRNDLGPLLESARRGTFAGYSPDLAAVSDGGNIDDDEAVLAAYNRMLAALAGHGEDPSVAPGSESGQQTPGSPGGAGQPVAQSVSPTGQGSDRSAGPSRRE